LDEVVQNEWAIATARLEAAGVPRWKIDTIQWHDFSWEPQNYPVNCGGVEAYGCYQGGDLGRHPTIKWWRQYDNTLRHEIGHGILDQLGYSCWEDWEHKDKEGNPRNGGCPR
jgi:hypothetical protein